MLHLFWELWLSPVSVVPVCLNVPIYVFISCLMNSIYALIGKQIFMISHDEYQFRQMVNLCLILCIHTSTNLGLKTSLKLSKWRLTSSQFLTIQFWLNSFNSETTIYLCSDGIISHFDTYIMLSCWNMALFIIINRTEWN